MKHTRKRALLSAIAMLVVSAVVLSSATFAWFSAGKTVTVDNLSATVSKSSGILISATGAAGTFGSNVALAELQGVSTNAVSSSFTPFSTIPSIIADSYNLTMVGGEIDADGKLTANVVADNAATDANYVAVDLYIQATDACTVTFAGTSVAGSSKNIARVAIVSSAPASTVAALLASGGSTVHIIEPDQTSGVTTYNGLDKAVPSISTVNGLITNTSYCTPVIPLTSFAGETITFTGAGYAKVRVYLWAEGQDADCTDTSFVGTGFNMNIDISKTA